MAGAIALGAGADSDAAAVVDMEDRSGRNMRIGDVRVGPSGDVRTLEDLDRQLQKPDSTPMDSLGGHLKQLLDKAKRHREQSGVDDELTESLLTREGEYSTAQKQILDDQNEPHVFEPLTGDIITNAVSWIKDMLNLPNGTIYELDASPLPEMPDSAVERIAQATMQRAMMELQQTGEMPGTDEIYEFATKLRAEVEKQIQAAAEEAASGMNRVIEDQFREGGFFDALGDVIEDIATFPTAWMKGPVVYEDEELIWTPTPQGPVPKVGKVFKPKHYAPSPFDMFPSPNCTRVNEGYLFERMRMEPAALAAFKNVPGFNADAIDSALDNYAVSGNVELSGTEQLRARLEKRNSVLSGFEGVIEVYEFTGKLQGKLLKEQGFSTKLEDNTFYAVIVWLCQGRAIMARLNTNPCGHWNVSAASYVKRSGTVWGKGVPQVVRADQKNANGYRRAASTNAASAAGFQTIVEADRMADGSDITTAYPGKVWQAKAPVAGQGASSRAVDFFQPQPIFQALEKLIHDVRKTADERAGIPPYAYGSDRNRGAADTVGGLSILMNNSAKGLREILRNLDKGIIKPGVTRQWFYNMLYHPDVRIKGDVNIVPRGALGQVVKEGVFLRRQEFMQMTANPFDMEIIGFEGRRQMLEEQEETLDFPKNSIIPSAEDLAERLKSKQQAAAPPQDEGVPGAERPQEGVDMI